MEELMGTAIKGNFRSLSEIEGWSKVLRMLFVRPDDKLRRF